MRLQKPAITAAFLILLATSLSAQVFTGKVLGKAVDSQGEALPGVSIDLSGVGAPQTLRTDERGSFRFLNLSPGQYQLRAELQGFATVLRTVQVNLGANTEIVLELEPALQETITVTTATPLLDARKIASGATVTQSDLAHLPSSRDPYAVLQTIPGIYVSSVTAQGNPVPSFVAKGMELNQTNWNLDGSNITDTSRFGTIQAHWNHDFESFDELQVTVGSSDPRVQTPGVQLNMVTKRGTNELRGSGRWLWADRSFQDDADVPTEARQYLARTDSLDEVSEYGAEAGGPVARDRAWIWAGWSRQQIYTTVAQNLVDGVAPLESRDNTAFEHLNTKLNWQATPNTSFAALFNSNERARLGWGAGPKHPPETAQNETNPRELLNLEGTHLFSPSFLMTALYTRADTKVSSPPAGGMDVDAWQDESGVWHRSYFSYASERQQDSARIDGALFFDGRRLNHELKFGFGYRQSPVETRISWAGSGNRGQFIAPGRDLAYLTRQASAPYEGRYADLYVGDTVVLGPLTFLLGARFDQQSTRNLPSSVPANILFPELLPAASFPGDASWRTWKTISPRVGATWTAGSRRKTLLRGAYNRYSALLSSYAMANNPFAEVQFLCYRWEDRNTDKTIQRDEVRFDLGLSCFQNIDPANPSSSASPTRIDYDAEPRTTDEFFVGVEHELTPGFTIAANYTYRTTNNLSAMRAEKTRGAGDFYTSDDYVLAGNATGTLPNGTPYSVPYYRLRPGTRVPTFRVVTNRPDYKHVYHGLDVMATRRMSERWSMRGYLSLHDWRHRVGTAAFTDPTFLVGQGGCNNCDDETFVPGTGGERISSRWSYSVSTVYELPWNFVAGGVINGREGFPVLYHHRVSAGDGTGQKNVLVTGVDDSRLDDLFSLDLRLSKEMRLRGDLGIVISADLFNATNERTVLSRDDLLYSLLTTRNPGANRVLAVQTPRVWRFGARLVF